MKNLINIYDEITDFINKYELIDDDLDLMIRILDLVNFLILKEVRNRVGDKVTIEHTHSK